jgi:hypothetical protein
MAMPSTELIRFWLYCVESCLIVAILLGQQPAAAATEPVPSAPVSSATPCPTAIDRAKVTGEAPSVIRPTRVLEVEIKDFEAWVACQQQGNLLLPTLFVNHTACPDCPATVNPLSKSIRFDLTINQKNHGWWAALASAANRAPGAAVGLGTGTLEHTAVVDTEVRDSPQANPRREAFQIVVADRWTAIESWSFAVVLVLVSLAMAWLSRLLRDRGPLAQGVSEWNRSFSLGRTQLFLWTVTVFGVSGILYIRTGTLPTLDTATLLLLGISASTTGLSTMIDGAQPPPVQAASKFFVADLLNDGANGPSIHRLQAVLANAGLAAIFIGQSLQKLDFYTIPDSWAALMALSSGAYLGLKAQEPR